jgi:short-subunit dehydrogenase
MSTSGPLALVTGASSGIGAAFARRLSAMGYRLLLVARRKDRLEQLASGLPGNAEVFAADLTNDADLRRVEERVAAEPDLEILVNNAGFGTLGRFFEADLEEQDRMHRLHVTAILRLSHRALRGMVARRKGAIINVSSVAAFLHNPFSVSYGATKAWINSFTEAVHLELKGIGSPVRVQALCPGFTHSEFHDTLGIDRSLIPRSLWMSAEEVVESSLRALERDRLIVIPGWRYRLFVGAQPWLPRRLRHFIALRYGSRNRQPVTKVISPLKESTKKQNREDR